MCTLVADILARSIKRWRSQRECSSSLRCSRVNGSLGHVVPLVGIRCKRSGQEVHVRECNGIAGHEGRNYGNRLHALKRMNENERVTKNQGVAYLGSASERGVRIHTLVDYAKSNITIITST